MGLDFPNSCCIYALVTGAVNSGFRVNDFPPWSIQEYISLLTMSVSEPTPLSNKMDSSNAGVEVQVCTWVSVCASIEANYHAWI